ncbi:RNA polymerase sigma-70 factor [uncultured Pontibacter sp.]|uniref:RNA polymerase sigma-70 factor n=1 Tax=uncultured Pontibacter sp. TaxID=453356 RepID=UPI00260B4879|nr:RNA polymerase sigma-70 factor [uncultured Pontibacter sp.]
MSKQSQKLQEYEALFRRNYERLCQRVQCITGDAAVAEDLVQEVFISFWNDAQWQEVENPEAYLYRAAINKTLNHVSSQKRRSVIAQQYQQEQPQTVEPNQELELQELQYKIQQTIDMLPPMCQKVFLLSRYEEMTHKEIADFLNISPNTVDNHIKKALAILRKALLGLLLVCLEIIFRFFPEGVAVPTRSPVILMQSDKNNWCLGKSRQAIIKLKAASCTSYYGY